MVSILVSHYHLDNCRLHGIDTDLVHKACMQTGFRCLINDSAHMQDSLVSVHVYGDECCIQQRSMSLMVCLSVALIWNSKELFSYIRLQKMDFLNLANSKLMVIPSPVAESTAVSYRWCCPARPQYLLDTGIHVARRLLA